MSMTGGCFCGALRYVAEGAPDWAGWCHCRDCQRQSGSDRRPFMGFSRERFVVTGEARVFRQPEDVGDVGLYFCPSCGSVVYSVPTSMPTHVSAYAGTLDDPSQFVPQMAIFVGRRWPCAAAALPEYEAMPPE